VVQILLQIANGFIHIMDDDKRTLLRFVSSAGELSIATIHCNSEAKIDIRERDGQCRCTVLYFNSTKIWAEKPILTSQIRRNARSSRQQIRVTIER